MQQSSGAKRASKIDDDAMDALRCLVGDREERYFLERYVKLGWLISLALFPSPQESQGRELSNIAAAATVINSVHTERVISNNSAENILSSMQSAGVCVATFVDALLRIGWADSLSDELDDQWESATTATFIVDAILQIESLDETGRNRRPSLAKAYDFISRGGQFPRYKPSLTTLKSQWSTWRSTLPLVCGFWEVGIDARFLNPFNLNAPLNFVTMLKQHPNLIMEILSSAKAIDCKLDAILDSSAKRKMLFRYPDFIPLGKIRPRRIKTKLQYIARAYGKRREGRSADS